MKKIFHISVFALFIAFSSCQSNSDSSNASDNTKSAVSDKVKDSRYEKDGLKLTPVKDSPEYMDAKISLNTPSQGAALKNGANQFSFGVENYVLGNQTPDADAKRCANSAKGQHIHLILNNQPYSAHYTNEFEKTLEDGYYVGLAFLSRSYHESIKTKDAYTIWDFSVGELEVKPEVDLSAPNIFYSRPKGKYIGAGNVEKIMLDFYLTNTEISESGNKVKAEINGTEFILSQWCPYFIEGLPMGENTIKLTLVDNAGKTITTPFNGVSRKIHLYQDEPLVDKQ